MYSPCKEGRDLTSHRTSKTRLKIYALLVEGKAQSTVASLLGLTKQNVCNQTRTLVDGGYLTEIKGSFNPKLYEKGKRGPELDAIVLSAESRVYARGVTSCSKSVLKVNTAKVHHLKFKAAVLKVGDTQFLKQYFNRRNVTRSKGQVPYYEHFVSVEFEETPNAKTFYIFPPEMDLTAEELGNYEVMASKVVMEILNSISKRCGWRFGIPEKTNWETHIAVENPALVGEISGKYNMCSQDGTAFLSNSDGAPELEFKSQGLKDADAIKQATIALELPGEVIRVKIQLDEMEESMAAIVKILSTQTIAWQKAVELNTLMIKGEAEAVVNKAKELEQTSEAAKAILGQKTEELGGMYR